VISWFQAFAFKWVNLYRYTEGSKADEISLQEAWVDEHFESQVLRLSGATADGSPVPINFIGGGLYKLTHCLKAPGFNP
jgi:hypothetical protein